MNIMMAFQVVVASNKIKSRNPIVFCVKRVVGEIVLLQVVWQHTMSIPHHITNFYYFEYQCSATG